MRLACINRSLFSITPESTILRQSSVIRPRMQSVSVSDCSNISFSMNVSYPPFSNCSTLIFSVLMSNFEGLPLSSDSISTVPPRLIKAISLSFRYTTLSVYPTIGVASEATKVSSSPIPMTKGLAFLAAMSMSGSPCSTTAMAYAPSTCPRASFTASYRLHPLLSFTYSMSCTSTSVSVSDLNCRPCFANAFFSTA